MGKIAICLPKLGYGGSERAAAILANYFVSVGVDVHLVLMYKTDTVYALDERVDVSTIIDRKDSWFQKVIIPLQLILGLRARFRHISPDAILALGYKSYILASCVGLDIRLIDSLRTNPGRIRFPKNRLLNTLYNIVRPILNKRADGVIAQTKRAKDVLEDMYHCEVVHIPNFIKKIELKNVDRENSILTVGRLSVEKGHRYLLDAFSRVDAPGWTLKIVGDGPQEGNLKEQAERLAIGERVIFEGFQSDVDTYMQKSTIFVLPSLIEGFPNALIEAMGNGMACVSFDCDMGPSEIIEHGENGLLVDVSDTEGLADAIKELINDHENRTIIAERGKKVKEDYSIDKIGEQYLKFLLEGREVSN